MRRLRIHFATRHPVKAERSIKIPEGGDARFVDGSSPHFVIRIFATIDDEASILHLACHEYAHCMTWFVTAEDHEDAWGDAVGSCLSFIFSHYDKECLAQ